MLSTSSQEPWWQGWILAFSRAGGKGIGAQVAAPFRIVTRKTRPRWPRRPRRTDPIARCLPTAVFFCEVRRRKRASPSADTWEEANAVSAPHDAMLHDNNHRLGRTPIERRTPARQAGRRLAQPSHFVACAGTISTRFSGLDRGALLNARHSAHDADHALRSLPNQIGNHSSTLMPPQAISLRRR